MIRRHRERPWSLLARQAVYLKNNQLQGQEETLSQENKAESGRQSRIPGFLLSRSTLVHNYTHTHTQSSDSRMCILTITLSICILNFTLTHHASPPMRVSREPHSETSQLRPPANSPPLTRASTWIPVFTWREGRAPAKHPSERPTH